MRGSGICWITAIDRRPDGSIRDVHVDMDGFKSMMSAEAVIEMWERDHNKVPNIHELGIVPDEDVGEDGGIVVSTTDEGFAVDLIVPLATCSTMGEARCIADRNRAYIDTESHIVKDGNSVKLGNMGRELRRAGLDLGDHVRVIVLKE